MPPTQPPTTKAPTTCGTKPEYVGDGACDDSNNNAGCNYDEGDCCPANPPPAGWDDFCTACECLEKPECKDESPASFCTKVSHCFTE